MKKLIRVTFFLGILVILGFSSHSSFAAQSNLTSRVKGYIVLSVEEHGEAYYVDPVTLKAYYMQSPDKAFEIMRTFGLGITDENLAKIPLAGTSQTGDWQLRNKLAGRILLQVQKNGEAWYVYPGDLKRYYLGSPFGAFNLMRAKGLGISHTDLSDLTVWNVTNPIKYSNSVETMKMLTAKAIESRYISYTLSGDYEKYAENKYYAYGGLDLTFYCPPPQSSFPNAYLITGYGASVPYEWEPINPVATYWQSVNKLSMVAYSQDFTMVCQKNDGSLYKKTITITEKTRPLSTLTQSKENIWDFTKWHDESSGPGLDSGLAETYYDGTGKKVIKLNSMKGGNYYMEKSYYLTVDNSSDLNNIVSWDWKQDSIDSPYGYVGVYIQFMNAQKFTNRSTESSYVLGTYDLFRHTGDFYKYSCDNRYAESTLGPSKYNCNEEIGAKDSWQNVQLNLQNILNNKLYGVAKDQIKAVKIKIVSYNNAGSGAVAYWRDFQINSTSAGTLQSADYFKLSPYNFSVKKGGDLITTDGEYVSPWDGNYSFGYNGDYLFKGVNSKPAEGCNIRKFIYNFQDFENKTVEITFKRSAYGALDFSLQNEAGQFVDFDSDSNDVPSNLVRACNNYFKCDYTCNDYAGGWIGSEYDWGQLTNDNQWHTLSISKFPDKFIFNLDNGKKIKEVSSVFGCNLAGNVRGMDYSGQVSLMVSGWSCKWKSDDLNYEVKEIKISR